MVTADPSIQRRLLDVQALDAAIAQLTHKRASLPELATIAKGTERAAVLHGQAVDLETRIGDIAVEQRRMENDIDVVRAREERNQKRLAGGGLPAKELEGLQHELVSLARRQASLEDSALEIMEQREDLETRQRAVQVQRDQLGAEQAIATAARDTVCNEIDASVGAKRAERAQVAGEVTPDLLALYDKVRLAQGGVGAAALRQRRCEGCRLDLAGSELIAARQAAPDDVLRCENCRRILVRTPESGL